jgi:hypothetical protein
MKTGNWKPGKMLAGILAAFTVWALSGCLTAGGGGVTVSSSDTAYFTMNFTNTLGAQQASDSIDVKKISDDLHDQDIDDSSIQITDLEVTFDDSSSAFLSANLNKQFLMEVFYGDTTRALSTDPHILTAIHPDTMVYEINRNIFGVQNGFVAIVNAIANANTTPKIKVTGKVTFPTSAPVAGRLKMRYIVTVTAKLKT